MTGGPRPTRRHHRCRRCGCAIAFTGKRGRPRRHCADVEACLARAGGRQPRRPWSPAEDLVLRGAYPDVLTEVIAGAIGRSVSMVYQRARRLGLAKSAEYLANLARASWLPEAGAPHRYAKGHVPFNKGLRRPGWHRGRMRETQFKKGQRGWNWRPVGSERLVDGYRYTKISDHRHVPWTKNWKPTHVVLWEKHRGPLPRGHCLRFRNGDRHDVRLANLELLTRAENALRNSIHRYPPEIVRVVQLRGALVRQINKRQPPPKARLGRPPKHRSTENVA